MLHKMKKSIAPFVSGARDSAACPCKHKGNSGLASPEKGRQAVLEIEKDQHWCAIVILVLSQRERVVTIKRLSCAVYAPSVRNASN